MAIRKDFIQDRLERVRASLDSWEVDGVLITNSTNRRWLSGFTGSAGAVLVTAHDAWLATDFRYWTQAEAQAPSLTLYKLKRGERTIKNLAQDAGVSTIGAEGNDVTVNRWDSLQEMDDVSWVALAETVEPWRAVKTTGEVAAIRAAAAITDGVMAQVNALARPGMTERALAWELEKRLRENGAHAVAFDVIVASGPNAGMAHHRPGERVLQPGDTLIVDMGAKLDGYHSDLTRSFYLGDEPDERFWEVYNLVLRAQETALNGIRPGQTWKEADALARDVIEDAGYGDDFGHGLGHGVGLDIHEDPHLSPTKDEDTVTAGMVTTVEPGIYLKDWGGVRIEDLVVVTDDGVERLSACPKQPIISPG